MRISFRRTSTCRRRGVVCLGIMEVREAQLTIYGLLQNSGLELERIKSVAAAYEDALRMLGLKDRRDPVTELLASKIIEVAQTGERDPARIRARAIAELGQ